MTDDQEPPFQRGDQVQVTQTGDPADVAPAIATVESCWKLGKEWACRVQLPGSSQTECGLARFLVLARYDDGSVMERRELRQDYFRPREFRIGRAPSQLENRDWSATPPVDERFKIKGMTAGMMLAPLMEGCFPGTIPLSGEVERLPMPLKKPNRRTRRIRVRR